MASRSVVTATRCVAPRAIIQRRAFASSARCMMNPLFNLSHFSASKEAQFFSKERRIPREEFHPHLQLIRASEVDPFAPVPGTSPMVIAALKRAETGQTDMQTAYSLAISNLGQQVVMMRREVVQAHTMLARIHEKYKREERNSFLVMLAAVAALSFILIKTDALEELKVYARETTTNWKGFDWEWLGNPPSYKAPAVSVRNGTRSSSAPPPQTTSTSTMTSAITSTPMRPVEAQSDLRARLESQTTSTIPPSDTWRLSRLFWAAPSRTDS